LLLSYLAPILPPLFQHLPYLSLSFSSLRILYSQLLQVYERGVINGTKRQKSVGLFICISFLSSPKTPPLPLTLSPTGMGYFPPSPRNKQLMETSKPYQRNQYHQQAKEVIKTLLLLCCNSFRLFIFED
jgi:hypothetical protein